MYILGTLFKAVVSLSCRFDACVRMIRSPPPSAEERQNLTVETASTAAENGPQRAIKRTSHDATTPGRIVFLPDDTEHSLTGVFQSFSQSNSAWTLCFFHTSLYYTLAVFGFSFLTEKWSIVDSLYFATTVFTTIGYGDLHPSNHMAMLYTVILATYGVVLLGIFLGIVGENVVNAQNRAIESSRQALRKKIIRNVKHGRAPEGSADLHNLPIKEKTLLEETVEVILLEAPIVSCVVALAMIAGHYEGWTVFESFYFAVVTGYTIGFGDYTPKHSGVKLACCFLLPLSVAALGEILGRIAAVYLRRQARRAEKQFLRRAMTLADLERMDTNRDGVVQRDEFLTFMLVALRKVDQEDIDELNKLFDWLDVTKTGTILKRDIQHQNWERSIRQSISTLDAASRGDHLARW